MFTVIGFLFAIIGTVIWYSLVAAFWILVAGATVAAAPFSLTIATWGWYYYQWDWIYSFWVCTAIFGIPLLPFTGNVAMGMAFAIMAGARMGWAFLIGIGTAVTLGHFKKEE